jgi:hypothetical protein
MQETAEQVTSAHPALLTLPNDVSRAGRSGASKPERPVGTVPVVVLDVDPQDLLQMTAPNDQQPIQALARTVPTHRSA